jgi:hypothetical protein
VPSETGTILAVTFDDMMDAQDQMLHGMESREFMNCPKVLELCLRALSKRSTIACERPIGLEFLESCSEFEKHVKKMESGHPEIKQTNSKTYKLTLSARSDEDSKEHTTDFDVVHVIREQIKSDNWQVFVDPASVATNVLCLIIVDFFRSFDSKLLPSTKRQDYSTRSKSNMRRKTLMHWAVRFLQLVRTND